MVRAVYDRSVEPAVVVEQAAVYVVQADELHVRVMDRAARERAGVFEEYDVGVALTGEHVLPVHEAETYDFMHVGGAVVRHLGIAIAALDQYILVGALHDIVFVVQEYHVAGSRDNAGQMLPVAKGAGSLAVAHRFRLLAPGEKRH